MIVTQLEYEAMFKEIDGHTFTPTYNLIEEEKEFKYEILKTADEVYKDYLNSSAQDPSEEEILKAKLIKDNADIQLQLATQQKLNADILLKLAKVGGIANV
jgi:hypothetical protein